MEAELVREPPRTVKVARAVGWVTFLEIVGDKILYNILLGCFVLFGVGVLASRLSFTRPERVVLDFGLSAVNLSCAAIAILAGASLIGREFERRTIYVALSHPISRGQFILGKFVGLASVVAVNWILLTLGYLVILGVTEGGIGLITPTLLIALVLLLMQSWILAGIAILFSTFSTTSLSVIMSIGFYLIGNNVSQVRLVAVRARSQFTGGVLNFFATILPNFEHFSLGTKVSYGLPVSREYFLYSMAYGIVLVIMMLLLAGLLIRSREV